MERRFSSTAIGNVVDAEILRQQDHEPASQERISPGRQSKNAPQRPGSDAHKHRRDIVAAPSCFRPHRMTNYTDDKSLLIRIADHE
jgi:ribosomal protein S6E (S10)